MFSHEAAHLYNTIVEVQANVAVSYSICVITRVNCIEIRGKIHGVLNDHLGPSSELCYILNLVVMNSVIMRFWCTKIKKIVLGILVVLGKMFAIFPVKLLFGDFYLRTALFCKFW